MSLSCFVLISLMIQSLIPTVLPTLIPSVIPSDLSMLMMSITSAAPALEQPAPQTAGAQRTPTADQAVAAEETEQGQTSIAGKIVAYRIRRLPLSAFPELPDAVRAALELRHCLVPQTYQARRPENVIRGHFRDQNTDDWAVLCSTQGTTSLLVLNDRAVGPPAEFPARRDLDSLARTTPAGDVFGYNWGIDVASPARMRNLSGHQSIHFDHDGIEDSTIEHSATIRYYQGGEWLAFDREE